MSNVTKAQSLPLMSDAQGVLSKLLRLSNAYYWVQDSNHQFTLIVEEGRSADSLQHFIGKTLWDIGSIPVSADHSWDEYKSAWLKQESFESFLIWRKNENNGDSFLSLSGSPRLDKQGAFAGYSGIIKRVTNSELNEQYINTLELLAIGIGHVNKDGRFIHVNQHLCSMLGYEQSELLKLTVREISHPDDEDITDDIRVQLHSGKIDSFKFEKRYLRKNKTPIWVGLTIAVNRGLDGKPLYDVSLVEDISARKKAEERVQYLASYDEMTDLPNRLYFSQLVTQTIKYASRYKRKFGVLFIDLDRFKSINDSLGHAAGDILLIEMAKRFKSCLRSSDVVARLGGDEFVVLVHEIGDKSQVITVARNILSTARKPFKIMGKECRVTASVGICMFPEGSQNEQTLMQNADKAMYLAKEEGKNNYQFYSDDLKAQSLKKIELESHLQNALNLNEFEIYYQPRVNVKTGAICGAEALLRWTNHELGAVSPAKFIPIAEEMGLILPIGKWVLKAACRQNRIWQDMGLNNLCISVNISPRQFLDPELISTITEALAKENISPELLELEVTEGVVAQNPEQAIERLNQIKEMGVRIAIDDFGTGYSSLSQLKYFPIDTLKIDRSFIRELPHDMENMAITEAIIVMSKLLKLSTVAEGVETAEQHEYLEKLGCDEIQGYYFGKATPAEKFEELVRNKSFEYNKTREDEHNILKGSSSANAALEHSS